MKTPKWLDLSIKILATIAVVGQRWYFGPVGAGAGACDGLVLYAIWRFGAMV
jgi:hypothetical protein